MKPAALPVDIAGHPLVLSTLRAAFDPALRGLLWIDWMSRARRAGLSFGLVGEVVLRRRRERCLLAILLLHNGAPVPVERLTYLLWDGEPGATARQLLHSHVSRVRAALREPSVTLRSTGTSRGARIPSFTCDPLISSTSSSISGPTNTDSPVRLRITSMGSPPPADADENTNGPHAPPAPPPRRPGSRSPAPADSR